MTFIVVMYLELKSDFHVTSQHPLVHTARQHCVSDGHPVLSLSGKEIQHDGEHIPLRWCFPMEEPADHRTISNLAVRRLLPLT